MADLGDLIDDLTSKGRSITTGADGTVKVAGSESSLAGRANGVYAPPSFRTRREGVSERNVEYQTNEELLAQLPKNGPFKAVFSNLGLMDADSIRDIMQELEIEVRSIEGKQGIVIVEFADKKTLESVISDCEGLENGMTKEQIDEHNREVEMQIQQFKREYQDTMDPAVFSAELKRFHRIPDDKVRVRVSMSWFLRNNALTSFNRSAMGQELELEERAARGDFRDFEVNPLSTFSRNSMGQKPEGVEDQQGKPARSERAPEGPNPFSSFRKDQMGAAPAPQPSEVRSGPGFAPREPPAKFSRDLMGSSDPVAPAQGRPAPDFSRARQGRSPQESYERGSRESSREQGQQGRYQPPGARDFGQLRSEQRGRAGPDDDGWCAARPGKAPDFSSLRK